MPAPDLLSVRALAMPLSAAEPVLALIVHGKVVLLLPPSSLTCSQPQYCPHWVLTGHCCELSQPNRKRSLWLLTGKWEKWGPGRLWQTKVPTLGKLCLGAVMLQESVFLNKISKDKRLSLDSCLHEEKRRGRGGMLIRDCKNSSLCVCLYEMFALEHLRLA